MTASTGTAFSFFFTLILAGDYASNESVIIEYSLLLFCNAAVKSRIERLFPIVIRLPGQGLRPCLLIYHITKKQSTEILEVFLQ